MVFNFDINGDLLEIQIKLFTAVCGVSYLSYISSYKIAELYSIKYQIFDIEQMREKLRSILGKYCSNSLFIQKLGLSL